MAKRRTAVIDADSILYEVAFASEVRIDDNEYLPLCDEDQAFAQVVYQFEALCEEADCDRALVCLSDPKRNFRKLIYPAYKSNRSGMRRPALLDTLRTKTMQEDRGFGKLMIGWLEADDVCGISYGLLAEQGMPSVIVSSDKDLYSIPCELYNPRPNAFSGSRQAVQTVTEAEADRFHLVQTLTGDRVDGYPGCPKVGFVGANKALAGYNDGGDMSGAEAWKIVVKLYEDKGLTEQDALVQARLARILRSCDWDVEKKKVKQWEPSRAV